jgi:DnaJ-class molecular chaperone
MKDDYYRALGVQKTADAEQVQDAYRRLAKAYHPDRSGGDTVQQFRAAQEAWETLGDPERRRAYDAARSREPAQPARAAGDSAPFIAPTWVGSGFADPAQDLHLELQMSAAEARIGGDIDIELPAWGRCPHCGGSGRFAWFPCPVCDGHGYGVRGDAFTLHVPSGLHNGAVVTVPLRETELVARGLVIHVCIVYGIPS